MLSIQMKAIFAKPCPFCGSRNVITEKKETFYGHRHRACTYIACDDCGAQIFGEPVRKDGGYDTDYNNAQHAALAAWNRRSA